MEFLFKIVFVALRETAGNIHLFDQPLFFCIYITKNGVDGFLFGIVNKTAGINHDNVCIVLFRFMGSINLVAFQLGEQNFAVHQVFRAPERYDVDFILYEAL